MIQTGIFAKTFDRPSFTEVLDAVVTRGYHHLQFNMACTGLPTLPSHIPGELIAKIATVMQARALKMAALSGTFNMIHPDPATRAKELKGLQVLMNHAESLGTQVITLCSGSCDPTDMWKHHPNNQSKASWNQLCKTLEAALLYAAGKPVILGIEPELANVINNAEKARLLLSTMGSPQLKIIFDPANLFEKAAAPEIENIIARGLDLLGEHLVIAHAKDRKPDGRFTAAGTGILPYAFFLKRLIATGFKGALITHSLQESEATTCRIFLNQQIAACQR